MNSMASNVTNVESSNGSNKEPFVVREELLMQKSLSRSSLSSNSDPDSTPQAIECSDGEPSPAAALLTCFSEDPMAENTIKISILEIWCSLEKIHKTIIERSDKGDINVMKVLEQLKLQNEQTLKQKADAQSILLQQERLNVDLYDRIVSEIRNHVLPHSGLQITMPTLPHVQGSMKLVPQPARPQLTAREGSALKPTPEDDSHGKEKKEPQSYFEEQSDVLPEYQFKCSQAILRDQEETVLIAINKADYTVVDEFLQQKKIINRLVWLIDKKVITSEEVSDTYIPATTDATTVATSATTTATEVPATISTTTVTASVTNALATDAPTTTDATTVTTFVTNALATDAPTTTDATTVTSSVTNALATDAPTTTDATTVTTSATNIHVTTSASATTVTTVGSASVSYTPTTVATSVTNVPATTTNGTAVAAAAAVNITTDATMDATTATAAADPKDSNIKLCTAPFKSDSKIPNGSEQLPSTDSNKNEPPKCADKANNLCEEVRSKIDSSSEVNKNESNTSWEQSVSKFEDFLSSVPLFAIQPVKLLTLIKERDEFQARVSNLEAVVQAKDEMIKQIKQDHKISDGKVNNIRCDARDQIKAEQNNMNKLISVFEEMLKMQSRANSSNGNQETINTTTATGATGAGRHTDTTLETLQISIHSHTS